MKENVMVEGVPSSADVSAKVKMNAPSLPVESEASRVHREAMEAKEADARAFEEAIVAAKITIDKLALPVVHEALNVFTHYQIAEHMVPADEGAEVFELLEVPVTTLGSLSTGDIRDIYKAAIGKGYRLCPPQVITTYAPKATNLALGIPLISGSNPDKQNTLRLEKGEQGHFILKSMAVNEYQPLPQDTVFLFYAPKPKPAETEPAKAVATE